jgi:hypothetical protein
VPQVATLALARPTFDVPYAEAVAADAFASLDRLGLNLVGPRHLLMDAAAVEAALGEVAGAGPLDLILLLQVTFTDAGAAVLAAGRADPAPVALWAFPEPRTGGRLRLNSLCGINLAAHALGLAGRRCHHLHLPADDPAVGDRLRSILGGAAHPAMSASAAEAEPGVADMAAAEAALAAIRGSRLGRIGEHPQAFPPAATTPTCCDACSGSRSTRSTEPTSSPAPGRSSRPRPSAYGSAHPASSTAWTRSTPRPPTGASASTPPCATWRASGISPAWPSAAGPSRSPSSAAPPAGRWGC